MQSVGFVLVAVGILGFGVVSGRLQRSVITPPMVFTAYGFLIGPSLLGLQSFSIETPWIHGLAQLALILVLFTDAARIDLRSLRREHDIPVRLLVIGLPLTIVIGTALAVGIFGAHLEFWEAAALAILLAPTDAALGQAVVSSKLVPVRIRQALNVESGLNDGIVLPVLLLVLSFAGMAEGGGVGYWGRFVALQLILGPLVGVAVGYLGGRVVAWCGENGWMTHTFQDLSALGLSLLAFAGAELIGGNGFIAAFAAGITIGNCCRSVCTCLYEFAEAEGQLLTLLIFMVVGLVMVPLVLEHMSWQLLVYGVLSLTIIRMLPVALSVIGLGLQPATTVFLGWFGPRGIASILFVLLVIEEFDLAGEETIFAAAVTTVLLSVLAHGLTAFPASKWYSEHITTRASEGGEHVPVSDMPVRLPLPPSEGAVV